MFCLCRKENYYSAKIICLICKISKQPLKYESFFSPVFQVITLFFLSFQLVYKGDI